VRTEYAAPTGLKFILVWDSTNMPRLTALGMAAKIAQPFMAGSGGNQMKSPARDGRKYGGRPQVVAVRKHLSSLAGLWTIAGNESQP
jgi:hypothetical protein